MPCSLRRPRDGPSRRRPSALLEILPLLRLLLHHFRVIALLATLLVEVFQLCEVLALCNQLVQRGRILPHAIPTPWRIAYAVLRVGDPFLGEGVDTKHLEDSQQAVL